NWVSRLPVDWLVGILLFLVALGFNFYRLGAPSIWFDEAFSVELARQPLPLLWHIIFGPEPNMELYYLFLHFWLGLTGLFGLNPTEFVVRFPSAIFATLSTLVLFALGCRYLGTIAASLGTLLYLLNYLQLTYAQQTRSYALQLLLLCIAWYALFAALHTQKYATRWWACYCVAMILAIYAHLFSGLILLAQMVAFMGLLLLPNVWRVQVRKAAKGYLLSLITIGVLSIPMLLESLQGAKTGWLPVPHWGDLPHLFFTISGYNRRYLLVGTAFVLLGLCALGAAYCMRSIPALARSLQKRQWLSREVASVQDIVPFVWSMLCWLIIPIVVSYVLAHGSIRLFSTRYLVTVVPALCLLFASCIALVRWRVVQVVLLIGLVVLAATSVPLYYQSAQVEDWNSTVHWMERQSRADDGLVCYDNEITQGCQIAVEYYLHAYPSAAHFSSDSPGGFSWEKFGAAQPESGGYAAALDTRALTAYAAAHSRIFFIVGRVPDDASTARVKSTQQWLDTTYRFIDTISTRTVTIRLYATQK
ncbi:MAG: glycosyltransferase family 39 protein, partial [Ktedonobacteraceae bacterium]|nr:glycosyltransferase family 39 protein [Ktedonobacteraceae bacterium]